MPKALQKIALFARKDTKSVVEILHSLKELLKRKDVVWESETAQLLGEENLPTVDYEDLGKDCDLIIVVGGDGSLLRCARAAQKHQTPLIGINKGRLGFLTDIRPNELETRLQAVLSGEYWSAERFLLNTKIKYPDGKKRDFGVALNDVILYPGDQLNMLEFQVFVDDQFLCSHRADGLIIATPTGSTAYNLSAGGPIIQPNVNAMVLLPMFSHSLTDRPIILPGDSHIRVEFSESNEVEGKLSCNTSEGLTIMPGAHILIEQASKKIRLIHPLDYDYYETLRNKLQWGNRLTH